MFLLAKCFHCLGPLCVCVCVCVCTTGRFCAVIRINLNPGISQLLHQLVWMTNHCWWPILAVCLLSYSQLCNQTQLCITPLCTWTSSVLWQLCCIQKEVAWTGLCAAHLISVFIYCSAVMVFLYPDRRSYTWTSIYHSYTTHIIFSFDNFFKVISRIVRNTNSLLC